MKKLLLFIQLLTNSILWSQSPTVGLLTSTPEVSDGFVLFSPATSKNVFLLNNCGEQVFKWETNYFPGLGVRLQNDGVLVRACRTANVTFSAGGGIGGRLEKYDPNGNVIWSYLYATNSYVLHHDIEVLPNGNILALAWEQKTVAEAIQAGRNPNQISTDGLWTEQIIEFQPVGNNQANIVWKWDLWDHLVQDLDNTKSNFGNVYNEKRKIDINYGNGINMDDWVHMNSINFDSANNRIVVVSRLFSEVWFIDHSTTTQEAAGSAGGNCGFGGDLLYRWGNVEAYRHGDSTDQKLFVPHDCKFITGKNEFTIFNNGADRPGGLSYSTAEHVRFELLSNCNFDTLSDGSFKGDVIWEYNEGNAYPDFYSHHVGGFYAMENGHYLICEGADGNLIEVDSMKNEVWKYKNPFTTGGSIVNQGTLPNSNTNAIFKAVKIKPDHVSLNNLTLNNTGVIELNPYPSICMTGVTEWNYNNETFLYPSLFTNELKVNGTEIVLIELYNSTGEQIFHSEIENGITQVNINTNDCGIFTALLQLKSGKRVIQKLCRIK